MNTESTPKKTIWKEVGLVVLGALLSLATTLYFTKRTEDIAVIDANTDSNRHGEVIVKADTVIGSLKVSNQQLTKILMELQNHSSLITSQSQSLTAGIAELVTAYQGPSVDTSSVAKIIDKLLGDIQSIMSNNKAITDRVQVSKFIAATYEDRLKYPASLERLVLPRGNEVVSAQPIDGQYYIGVQGDFSSGQSAGVYGSIDGRPKSMRPGDTAMIYTGPGSMIKVTLERIEKDGYVFGVNHLKR